MRRPIAFVGISLLLVFYPPQSKAVDTSGLGMILALISSGQTATWVEPAGDSGPKLVSGLKDEGFLDIAQASFTTNAQGWMVLSAQMHESLEGLPDPNSLDGIFVWSFSLDSNPAISNNSGLPWPNNNGTRIPPEFTCLLQWDGTSFSSYFEDRRPTEQGNPVVIYNLDSFAVGGNVLAIAVPPELASMVVPQPGARWILSATFWNTGADAKPSSSVHFADSTDFTPWPQ
jgi:hypothetical protein